ncbi:peptidylprolyl isomerase [Desulfuromonas versatilis]|uniref:Peptidylprolyl isomerase n=2 Tax=Desulfuromonas versatilis TaxID=2802975 RepID=A0ABN6DUN7_9BACT|nr:peptidylprolyl isomerase [Desulfuromonas versatilis]
MRKVYSPWQTTEGVRQSFGQPREAIPNECRPTEQRILMQMTFHPGSRQGSTPTRMFLRGKLVAAAALVLLAGLAQAPVCAAADETAAPGPDAQVVVAKVNDQPIYSAQIAPAVEKSLGKYRNFGVQNPSEQYVNSIKAKVLEEFIAAELLYQAAQKLPIADLKERVSKQIEALKGSHRQDLRSKSDDELADIARRQIVIGEYMNRNELLDPQVPEEQIREYFEKNKVAFTANEAVNVRHILIAASREDAPETRNNALEKALKARQEIVDGRPFEEVAKEVSDCNSAPGGGQLGYQERGFMPKEFDEVAFAAEPAVLSQPVETQYGYHVLEVLEHRQSGVRPYEEVRDFIGKFLSGQLREQNLAAHLKKLREQAKVEILLN